MNKEKNSCIFNQVLQRKTGYLNDERRRAGGWVGVNNWFPGHNSETV